jgi:hypothetical protein
MTRIVAASILAIVAASACSAPPASTANPSVLNPTATSAAIATNARRPDHRRSWLRPDIKKHEHVLFVSDASTGDVYLYKLPGLDVVGRLTGFDQPQGECSDTKGDVWVTDANGQTIYELSHQGKLEARLSDTSGYPVGCAWDASTGNLAVMNLFGLNSTAGAVLIYPDASKSPTSYANAAQYYYDFGSYNTQGDLFFDGRNANGSFMLSELPKGASSAKTISVTGGTIYFPGLVQWGATYLNVGDQDCGNLYSSCVYWLTVGAKSAAIEGKASLESSSGEQICDLAQGVILKNAIYGSDNDFCGYGASATYAWPYPGGGSPTSSNDTVDSTPVGAAVSEE